MAGIDLQQYTKERIAEGKAKDKAQKERVDKLVGEIVGKPKQIKSTQKKPYLIRNLSLVGKPLGGPKKSNLKDRIKVLRFQNKLEKMRLANQIERLKLQKRVKNLQMSGKIPLPVSIRPRIIIPAMHPNFEANVDINSSFTSDIGTRENMFGTEGYFDTSDFFDENFFGTESFFGNALGIRIKSGTSPLLW